MEFIGSILWSLDRTKAALHRAVKELTPEQVAWRPCEACNSIGSMIIHLGRVEDTWVSRMTGEKDIWESDGWAQRFGLPENDRGWSFDKQSMAEKKPLAELLAYHEASDVRFATTIREMPADRYQDEIPSPLNLNVEQLFAHVVNELNMHAGQIDYLRGQQQSAGA